MNGKQLNAFSHIQFLKSVLLYALTAFGGAQAHLAIMLKTFVNKRKDITEQELLEYNAFCQLLPGASSTQILTLIGYKRGGLPLAIATVICWIAPACIIMGGFSFAINHLQTTNFKADFFKFIQPMAVGFLAFASYKAYLITGSNKVGRVIMVLVMIATYFLFKSPWVFPGAILLGGLVTNFTEPRVKRMVVEPRPIKWGNILLFLLIFIIAGTLSETARNKQWPERKALNLFENMYRFGSLVFGGGDVLMPMMYEQYVTRPNTERIQRQNQNVLRIDRDEFLTGAGFVKAIPGPTFSFTAFVGGEALKKHGKSMQVWGCVIASVAVFLPSILLVLFFFPVWNNLKKYGGIFRALKGINAAVVGIMIASTLYLMKDIAIFEENEAMAISLLNIGVILGTFLLLVFTRIAAPFIVLLCLALGALF